MSAIYIKSVPHAATAVAAQHRYFRNLAMFAILIKRGPHAATAVAGVLIMPTQENIAGVLIMPTFVDIK
jgi:hypothetical protein